MSDDEGGASIPDKPRRLRACLYCSYVHTAEHFNSEGCPNCRDFFQVDGTRYVRDCTTANFSGVIAMMQPSQSWVARHQRIAGVPGMYAVSVTGTLPDSIIADLRAQNIPYHPRDPAFQ